MYRRVDSEALSIWNSVSILMASSESSFLLLLVSGNPGISLALILGLGATALAATARLGILLARTRAAQDATKAAHTASGQGSILVDGEMQVLEINEAARDLLWPNRSEGKALTLSAPIQELLGSDEEQHHLLTLGTDRLIELSISPSVVTRFSSVRGIAVRDVTEQRKGQRHLVHLAHYDSLTGLSNRRLFVDRLEAAISNARGSNERVALFYVDLDRFKEVNDTLGHGAGDALLKTLAKRFQEGLAQPSSCRKGGEISVSRLSGDEFAIVIPVIESISEVEEVAQSVLDLIGEPMMVADRSIASSGSVGVALFPDHADEVEDLVKHADSALYVAKDMGRARFVLYEEAFGAETDRTHQIEQELRKAIERGEFALHYQPKVDLDSDTVGGFEALLRWYNQELGFVGPKEFIPVAEDRGMISDIGAWCLDEACRQIRVWQDAGFQVVPVSVNVSSAQFRNSDVERILSDALVRHNIHPSLLEIELTESLLLANDDSTALALRDLRSIGVRVALDDFGTGYSALTYLNRFPLDVVKMDRGFLRDIEDSDAAAGIASAVVSMSHSLGFEVVAEGVDSPAQADLLRTMGCNQIQGFLFSPAIPSEEATRFLATGGQARPPVKPIIGGSTRPIGGRVDPKSMNSGKGNAERALPPNTRLAEAPPRVLVIDQQPSTLGQTAFRMTRLDADVHLVTELEEAMVFLQREEPDLDLVIAPAAVDLPSLAELMERIRKMSVEHVPRLLMIGEEADRERRDRMREAGADWVLWDSFEDRELRFFVNAARSNRNWKFQRQSVRVPIDEIAWIRAGGHRGAGVLTSLSRRGAFIETSENYTSGQPIRVEFKLDQRPISVFANVTRMHEIDEGDEDPNGHEAGIDVIFYEVDEVTEGAIEEAVERRWSRYRP
ncbi:MAG: EAL domain-containing protein [Myxococcota bacterium]